MECFESGESKFSLDNRVCDAILNSGPALLAFDKVDFASTRIEGGLDLVGDGAVEDR